MDSVKIYTVEMILSSMTLHFPVFLSDTYTALDLSMTSSTGPIPSMCACRNTSIAAQTRSR